MLEEDYCSYEVAKLLEEKGFDEPCIRHWDCDDHSLYGYNDIPISNSELQANEYNGFSAPSQSMAMKWLREVHQLYISVDVCPIYGKVKDEKGRNTCGLLYWHYIASGEWVNEKYNPNQKAFVVSAKTYEEAVGAALKYSLENLI